MSCQCEECKRVRSQEELKKLCNRLSRVEGQIRGIRNMLENDAYCMDILTQVQAATSALNAFNIELLNQHISTCVRSDLESGSDEKLEELLAALKKMMR